MNHNVTKSKKKLVKKHKLLKPVNEEDTEIKWVSNSMYTKISNRIHVDLKQMKIGRRSKEDYFLSPKKFSMLLS